MKLKRRDTVLVVVMGFLAAGLLYFRLSALSSARGTRVQDISRFQRLPPPRPLAAESPALQQDFRQNANPANPYPQPNPNLQPNFAPKPNPQANVSPNMAANSNPQQQIFRVDDSRNYGKNFGQPGPVASNPNPIPRTNMEAFPGDNAPKYGPEDWNPKPQANMFQEDNPVKYEANLKPPMEDDNSPKFETNLGRDAFEDWNPKPQANMETFSAEKSPKYGTNLDRDAFEDWNPRPEENSPNEQKSARDAVYPLDPDPDNPSLEKYDDWNLNPQASIS